MKQGNRTINLEISHVIEQLGLTNEEMKQFLSDMNEKYGGRKGTYFSSQSSE